MEEVRKVIKKLKNDKAPGENGVTAELIKSGGECLEREIHEIISQVWSTENMPDRWNKALICPLHKKGDTTKCENYRGIALLDQVYKIMAAIIKDRLNEILAKEVGEYQCGFLQHRSDICIEPNY